MTEVNKDSLEFFIYKKTGGLYDPRLVKEFIGILEEWLPEEVKGANKSNRDFYINGYNQYAKKITKNLWMKK
jgi:hypothetical protein